MWEISVMALLQALGRRDGRAAGPATDLLPGCPELDLYMSVNTYKTWDIPT